MPGRDGTGPLGRGEITGRGLGVCAGFGRRSGLGFSWRRGMGRQTARESLIEHKAFLQERLDLLTEQIKDIDGRDT